MERNAQENPKANLTCRAVLQQRADAVID